MSSPDVTEFDPLEAVELWHQDSRRSRRVDYGCCRKSENEAELSHSDTDLCSDGELSDMEEECVPSSPLASYLPPTPCSPCNEASSDLVQLEM